MILLSQRDKRWKDITLGTKGTIGDYGCTITCLAIIIGTTPDVINERLKAVNGYAEGNLVIWAKIEEAFPGIKIKRVWSYNNDDVLKNVPNVLVEVDGKPIGGYRHWVVFVGGKKMIDPWDGVQKSTSSYPSPLSYCVIGGKWNKPSPVQDTVAVDKTTFENLVRKSTICDKVRSKLNVEDSETVIIAELEKLISYENTVIEKESQLKEAAQKIETLDLKLKELTDSNKSLIDESEEIKRKFKEQEGALIEQGGLITDLSREIERLKKLSNISNWSGWKKSVIDFLSRI